MWRFILTTDGRNGGSIALQISIPSTLEVEDAIVSWPEEKLGLLLQAQQLKNCLLNAFVRRAHKHKHNYNIIYNNSYMHRFNILNEYIKL